MTKPLICSNALVGYLDLLGYQETIFAKQTSLDAKSFFDVFEEGILTFKGLPNDSSYPEVREIKDYLSLDIFSDSIIIVFNQFPFLRAIGRPAEQAYAINTFAYFISFLAQYFLCNTKHLSRGAIVMGQCYLREFNNLKGNHFVYSKGLCKAHKYAENIADTPRILVDSSVLKTIKNVSALEVTNSAPQNSLLIDSDGLYYLNVYKSFLDNRICTLSTSKFLKEVISDGLRKYNEKLRYFRKWAWFANYHNNMMSKIASFSELVPSFGGENFGTEIRQLKIEEKLIRRFFRLKK